MPAYLIMINEDEKHFTVQQAAKLLYVSPKTIRSWAQKKKLEGIKVGPRGDWRFTRKQLEKMIKTI